MSLPTSFAHDETHERPPDDAIFSGRQWLGAQQCLRLHRLMVRSRVLDERMIKMAKSGEALFWVGGPGEEAFNIALGLQVKTGRGPAFDYLHLHYRNAGVMLAMGMPPIDAIRQIATTRTDPFSMGRNFVGHFAKPEWNVVPVNSAVENQFAIAPGTALVQRRHGGEGISIVVGGDAGSAEGDFATCMIWSARPGCELPVLIIVTNNRWGISTPCDTQHAERRIVDRGAPLKIPGEVVDGNDPVASWHAIARAMQHCRSQRRPFMIEALVSRLYGHSSASGAVRVEGETDCIPVFEKKLLAAGLLDRARIRQLHEEAAQEIEAAVVAVLREPRPRPDDTPRHTYAASRVDRVYPDDYTGLPR